MKPYCLEEESETISNKETLHYCLKQLEFISCFESHIENKKDNKYPVELLKKLEYIKYQAKVNTITAISYYKGL